MVLKNGFFDSLININLKIYRYDFLNKFRKRGGKRKKRECYIVNIINITIAIIVIMVVGNNNNNNISVKIIYKIFLWWIFHLILESQLYINAYLLGQKWWQKKKKGRKKEKKGEKN